MDNQVVYTANLGDKDDLLPIEKEEGVDYICFSDVPFEHETWQFKYAYPYGLTNHRRICRMYKILSHIWFPNKETIWIDARGGFGLPVTKLFSKYKSDYVTIRPHHDRDCVYEEAGEVMRLNYDDSRLIETQMKRYMKEGFPRKYGLHETGCLIRDNSAEPVREFNAHWWAEVATGSLRDQLSFDYVRWKLAAMVKEMDRKDIYFLKHKVPTTSKT